MLTTLLKTGHTQFVGNRKPEVACDQWAARSGMSIGRRQRPSDRSDHSVTTLAANRLPRARAMRNFSPRAIAMPKWRSRGRACAMGPQASLKQSRQVEIFRRFQRRRDWHDF